jgi:hypothetical protein
MMEEDSTVTACFVPDAGARPAIQFMRWCDQCEAEELFTCVAQLANGLLGCCQGCGDERVIPYQRTNSEAA